jgi:hypothetical protein
MGTDVRAPFVEVRFAIWMELDPVGFVLSSIS